MSDVVEKLVIKGDSSEAQGAADKMQESLTGAFAKGAIAAELFTKLASKAFDFVKEGVTAALEQERAFIQQRIALEALGDVGGRWAGILRDQADALKEKSGIDEVAISKMQTLALNYGVTSDKIDDFIRASIELSNVTGQDVNGAMDSLIKLQSGVLDRNLRLVPGMAALAKEGRGVSDAVQLINDKWGNYLGLKLEGEGGQIHRLKLDFEDLEKSIGQKLVPSIGNLVRTTLSMVKGEGGETGLGFFEQIARWEAAALGWDAKVNELTKLGEARMREQKETVEAIANAAIADGSPKAIGGGFAQLGKDKKKIDFSGMNVADWNEAEIKAAEDKAKILESLDAKMQKGMNETAEANLRRQVDITNWAEDEKQKKIKQTSETMVKYMGMGTGLMADMIENLVTGSEKSYQKMIAGFVRMVGQKVLASGAAHMAEGVAAAAATWWAGGVAGDPLIAAAAAEMALGAVMVGGGAAWEGGIGGGGGSRATPTGKSVTSGFSASMGVGAPSSTTGSQSGERRITIMVDGNLSPVETGLYVKKALDAAYKEGVIT